MKTEEFLLILLYFFRFLNLGYTIFDIKLAIRKCYILEDEQKNFCNIILNRCLRNPKESLKECLQLSLQRIYSMSSKSLFATTCQWDSAHWKTVPSISRHSAFCYLSTSFGCFVEMRYRFPTFLCPLSQHRYPQRMSDAPRGLEKRNLEDFGMTQIARHSEQDACSVQRSNSIKTLKTNQGLFYWVSRTCKRRGSICEVVQARRVPQVLGMLKPRPVGE